MSIKRVGVIGGGQLAWMMAGAARKLGVELVVQTPSQDDPAVAIAAETIFAAVDDANATATLASRCDVITFENEFVDIATLSPLAQQGICFRPGLEALSRLLDKYQQRCYLQQIGIPQPKFIELAASLLTTQRQFDATCFNGGNLGNAVAPQVGEPAHATGSSSLLTSFGFPVVLKARRHGYDGQGTFIAKDLQALQQTLAARNPKQPEQPQWLLEEFIPFERELAVMASRSSAGEIVTYPIVETQQEAQVCRRVLVPAEISSTVQAEIEAIARTLLSSLQVVGIFGIELFLTREGKVLVNEIAPRTHNSGHYTLDACVTSQFEQHLRAVCGLPLGNPALLSAGGVMVNLLGYEYSQHDYWEQRRQLEQIPQAHVHWYGKTESRPGRKLGHVTVLLDAHNYRDGKVIARKIEAIWYKQ